MKGTLVIFRKEFAGFFKSPLFYFLSFMMTILLSILFSISLDKFAQTSSNAMLQFGTQPQLLNIHYSVFLPHLSIINLIFIFSAISWRWLPFDLALIQGTEYQAGPDMFYTWQDCNKMASI